MSEHAIEIGKAQWTSPDGARHWAIGDRAVDHNPGTMLMYTACGSHDIPAGKSFYNTSAYLVTCESCRSKQSVDA